jgi:hypothetical protein
MPWHLRVPALFVVGFLFGAVLEVFLCKSRLYETVMGNKSSRRVELDEFVVDFRKSIDGWQRVDMERSGKRPS